MKKQSEEEEFEEPSESRYSKYPKLEDIDSNQGICCLIISEYLKTIDPERYFITTGEAIHKMDIMIKDANDFIKAAKKLKKSMIKAKASSKYLETGWEDGILVLKQKNLRIK